MSLRSRSAADIIGRSITAVTRPLGGTRLESIRWSPLAPCGYKPIRFHKLATSLLLSARKSQNYKTKPIREVRMTTFRQIEANRRNALKSTGPKTEAGKEQSRCNAVRHGLTAATVIGLLEDVEDYRQFEAAVTADYDAQSAVERELVLRLASVLWRLRRATTFETGLFEIQAEHLREYRQNRHLLSDSRNDSDALPKLETVSAHAPAHYKRLEELVGAPGKTDRSAAEFALCFLRRANVPNFAFDRLSRYEATLWRQAGQILCALEMLDRRKPQERSAHFWYGREKPIGKE
jgi:hypothetical protein